MAYIMGTVYRCNDGDPAMHQGLTRVMDYHLADGTDRDIKQGIITRTETEICPIDGQAHGGEIIYAAAKVSEDDARRVKQSEGIFHRLGRTVIYSTFGHDIDGRLRNAIDARLRFAVNSENFPPMGADQALHEREVRRREF